MLTEYLIARENDLLHFNLSMHNYIFIVKVKFHNLTYNRVDFNLVTYHSK